MLELVVESREAGAPDQMPKTPKVHHENNGMWHQFTYIHIDMI
jgi:hypothetical protein